MQRVKVLLRSIWGKTNITDDVLGILGYNYRPSPGSNMMHPLSSSFEVDEQYIGMGVKDVANLTDFFWLPAEPSGAVSLTTMVSVCNPAMEIRSTYHRHRNGDNNDSRKSAKVLYRGALKTFFNVSTDFLDSYFWTKVVYDEYRDRFVIAAAYIDIAADSSKNSSIYMAVSTSGSPVGPNDWYIHAMNGQQFNATTKEYTFLNNIGVQIGVDAVYVTASRFGSTSIDLYDVVLFVISKDGFYDERGNLTYSTLSPYRQLSSSIDDTIRNQIPLANDLFDRLSSSKGEFRW